MLTERTHAALQIMYNLTVDIEHTYFVLAGPFPVLVHNTSCQRFGSLSPSGRLDIPNVRGVYRIEMNDGTIYIGKATDIHSRITRAFTDPKSALAKMGYKSSDVKSVDWIEAMPGDTDQDLFDMEAQWIQYEGGIDNLANRYNSPGSGY